MNFIFWYFLVYFLVRFCRQKSAEHFLVKLTRTKNTKKSDLLQNQRKMTVGRSRQKSAEPPVGRSRQNQKIRTKKTKKCPKNIFWFEFLVFWFELLVFGFEFLVFYLGHSSSSIAAIDSAALNTLRGPWSRGGPGAAKSSTT